MKVVCRSLVCAAFTP
ncbi:hypothetical protein OC508_21505 [Vibrio vulnificus]|nr:MULTISPECIES: hypothetical protein [Vibrio]MCU8400181.1 hypothetical protein [Vibrio vulnificus]MDF4990462.1 hypothetical protein [Vibrio parahaemolyticus]MDL2014071.1 hypothetical protein [Vibrio parahaemolyticus]